MLPDLRQALEEAKEGVGRVTTPEQILVRQARQKSRLTHDLPPEPVPVDLRNPLG
ncbi:hypothetical protein [Pseudacidovorax intermedius]|uniref:hypothetical protein n=1 Tax=Pseudacidovorax intermedius TaxID=433924 RepID=UPI001E47489A|nr:hypothetical protein [Pseudacidovorax intermedius]